jgi:hypothetical protein
MDEQAQIYENMKQIIEVSQQRGCWKASEMKDIGITYEIINKLVDKLTKSDESLHIGAPATHSDVIHG